MRWFCIGLALGVLVALPRPSLTIAVSPAVLFEGAAVRVRCRVPLSTANRRLEIALEGYRYSDVPIAGDAGPITTEITYDHVPCEVSEASCTVVTDAGMTRRVAIALTVVCRL